MAHYSNLSMDFHAWLELPNGDIIDPHFPFYDWVANSRGVAHEKQYHPANQMVQACISKALAAWQREIIEAHGGIEGEDLVGVRRPFLGQVSPIQEWRGDSTACEVNS